MRRRCSALLIPVLLMATVLAPLLVASTPMGARAAARHALAQITKEIHAAVVESARAPTVPTGFRPPLSEVGAEFPAPWADGCLLQWTPIEQPECVPGDVTSTTTIALFGDSHAAQWFPALEEIAERRHWRLRTLTKVVCPR